MTKEEAIARIKDHIEIHKFSEPNAIKIAEALYMAIKALEHPVIRCEECKYWIPGYIANTGDGIDADVDVDRFDYFVPPRCGKYQQMVGHSASDYCSLAEAKENIR
jgi:hypothetical protein